LSARRSNNTTQAGRLKGIRDQPAEEDLAVLGNVVDGVAGGIEGLGSRIDTIDSDHVLDVAHDVARRRGPLVFAAGGALDPLEGRNLDDAVMFVRPR
jgi:hypothetical protein